MIGGSEGANIYCSVLADHRHSSIEPWRQALINSEDLLNYYGCALDALDSFFLVLPLRALPQSVQQAGVQKCKQPADSR